MTKIYKLVAQPSVADVACNRCGRSCKEYLDARHEHFNLEYMSFRADWGYPTPVDLEAWAGELCVDCAHAFREWIKEAGGELDVNERLDFLQ